MWTCSLCRIGLSIETIESHLSRNHLTNRSRQIDEEENDNEEEINEEGLFRVWSCGVCQFKAGNFERMASHCLRERHDPGLVRRAREFDAYHANLFDLLKSVVLLQKPLQLRKRKRPCCGSSNTVTFADSLKTVIAPMRPDGQIDWKIDHHSQQQGDEMKPSLSSSPEIGIVWHTVSSNEEENLFKIRKSTFSNGIIIPKNGGKSKKSSSRPRMNLNLPEDINRPSQLVSNNNIDVNQTIRVAASYHETTVTDSNTTIETIASSRHGERQNDSMSSSVSAEMVGLLLLSITPKDKNRSQYGSTNDTSLTEAKRSAVLNDQRRPLKSTKTCGQRSFIRPEHSHPLKGREVDLFPSSQRMSLATIDGRVYRNNKRGSGRVYWTCEYRKAKSCKTTLTTENRLIVDAKGVHVCADPNPERVEAKKILGYRLHSDQIPKEDMTLEDVLDGIRPEVMKYMPKPSGLRKCLARAKFRPYFKPYDRPIIQEVEGEAKVEEKKQLC